MKRKLSISQAWDECREILRRNDRLFTAVALALIVLPGVVQSLVTPPAPVGQLPPAGPWIAVVIVCILVSIAGQLAIIRIAVGPGITVGEAIRHGAKRMPIYVAALVIWILPFAIVGGLLFSLLVPPNSNPIAGLGLLLLVIALLFFAVRLIISGPIASAEGRGPLGILTRSWELSRGNWWRLFGFFVLLLIAALCVSLAVEALAGTIVGLLFGKIEHMSVGALIMALLTQLAVTVVTVVFLVMIARIYVQLSGYGENPAEVFA